MDIKTLVLWDTLTLLPFNAWFKILLSIFKNFNWEAIIWNMNNISNSFGNCGKYSVSVSYNDHRKIIYSLALFRTIFNTLLLLLLSRFSRVRLRATPQTTVHQAPPSLGFSRQEYWSGVPLFSLLTHCTSVLIIQLKKKKKLMKVCKNQCSICFLDLCQGYVEYIILHPTKDPH